MRRMLWGTALVLVALVAVAFVWVRPALAQGQTCVRVGGDLIVAAGESCAGDAVAIAGDVVVQGTVGGNAVALGGSVRVSGQVAGNVASLGGEVQLLDGARVGGSVAAFGGALHRSPAAFVRGNVLESGFTLPVWASGEGRPLVSVGLRLLGAVLASGLAFGLCLLVALVLRSVWPQRSAVMVATLRHEVATSFGMGLVSGLLLAVLVPLVTVFLVVILIGILVVPFLYILIVLLYIEALTITGLALGEALIVRRGGATPPQWLAAALGLAILVPVTIFPAVLIPCLGVPWALLVPSGGVGAIVLSRLGTVRRPAAGLPA